MPILLGASFPLLELLGSEYHHPMKLMLYLLLLVPVSASPLFPENDSQEDIQISVVELPPGVATSLLWGKPMDPAAGILPLLESGTAKRRTTIGCTIDPEGKGHAEEGANVEQHRLFVKSTRNAGPPVPYSEGHKDVLVGTQLSIQRETHKYEPAILEIRFTHHIRPPALYHWKCGSLTNGEKLIFPHFHTLDTRSTILADRPQTRLIAAGKLSGEPTENVFLVFAKQTIKNVPTETAKIPDQARRMDTLTIATRSREIQAALLRRTGS